MFYWKEYMVDQQGLPAHLHGLGPVNSVALAAACTQHVLLSFEKLRQENLYLPSHDVFLRDLLEIIEEIWASLEHISLPLGIASIERKLNLLTQLDRRDAGMANEDELFGATTQTIECIKSNGVARRVMLALEDAYTSVSKWYLAKSFRGKAMNSLQITIFERQSPECLAELRFQLSCLNTLQDMRGTTPSYANILASLGF